MILATSEAYKDGKTACLAGLQMNRNPYLHKKGVIANLQRNSWDRGFKTAESESRGA